MKSFQRSENDANSGLALIEKNQDGKSDEEVREKHERADIWARVEAEDVVYYWI